MVYRDMGISAVSCNWPQGKSELYRKRQEYEEEEYRSPGIERNCCSSLEQLLTDSTCERMMHSFRYIIVFVIIIRAIITITAIKWILIYSI